MPNYTGGADTVCPFYLREEAKSISCEGFGLASVMTMKFKKTEEKRAWQNQYCFLFSYGRCPIAAAIAKKYETQEARETAAGRIR